jgi:hypothetical protein
MGNRMMKFEFTKRFTKGTFVGATFADTMTFLSLSDFAGWVRDINAAHAKGKLDYYVTVER